MGAMKIWMLRLSLNACPLLVYTLNHILFFTSLFTLFELEFFCVLLFILADKKGSQIPLLGEK